MLYDKTQALKEVRLIKRRLNQIRVDFSNKDVHKADLDIDFDKKPNSDGSKKIFRHISDTLHKIEVLEHSLIWDIGCEQ